MNKPALSLLLLVLYFLAAYSLPVELRQDDEDEDYYNAEIQTPQKPECYKHDDCSFCCFNPITKVKLTVKRARCDDGLCQCLCEIL
ncbi:unnamed protein product [Bursaphelenchus xylophilus]|uniref:(pine wood nematode) hypothetical protein n=1 Tax=Bursaphelenchus xylophilus TaxID=6326 RepID=A0A1I7RLY5_BURXY|nr:unnamed protein product [Bursaphelenchus xylophilus]CAG9113349.1 unnamed protein product [Bursaphelenchus xylophilus]